MCQPHRVVPLCLSDCTPPAQGGSLEASTKLQTLTHVTSETSQKLSTDSGSAPPCCQNRQEKETLPLVPAMPMLHQISPRLLTRVPSLLRHPIRPAFTVGEAGQCLINGGSNLLFQKGPSDIRMPRLQNRPVHLAQLQLHKQSLIRRKAAWHTLPWNNASSSINPQTKGYRKCTMIHVRMHM